MKALLTSPQFKKQYANREELVELQEDVVDEVMSMLGELPHDGSIPETMARLRDRIRRGELINNHGLEE
jgi:hypothetical protein